MNANSIVRLVAIASVYAAFDCSRAYSELPPPPVIILTPTAGHAVGYNGNNGDHLGGPVPANLALAPGATAIGSSELGAELALPFHRIANVNDGSYGNPAAWIGASDDPNPWVGVALGGLFNVTSIAWGRDNLGSFSDRSLGVYTFEYTIDPVPNAGSAWTTHSMIDLVGSNPGVFDPSLRHEFEVFSSSPDFGSPVLATGIRLKVPNTGIANGTAIDELEVYGTAVPGGSDVPEPASTGAVLFCLAGVTVYALQRRHSKSD